MPRFISAPLDFASEGGDLNISSAIRNLVGELFCPVGGSCCLPAGDKNNSKKSHMTQINPQRWPNSQTSAVVLYNPYWWQESGGASGWAVGEGGVAKRARWLAAAPGPTNLRAAWGGWRGGERGSAQKTRSREIRAAAWRGPSATASRNQNELCFYKNAKPTVHKPLSTFAMIKCAVTEGGSKDFPSEGYPFEYYLFTTC